MNEQTLIDMYRAGCVIKENEHLQYAPPADFCDNLPKVVMVGADLGTSGNIIQKLEELQDEGKLGIVCWEQEDSDRIEESLLNRLECVDKVSPVVYDVDTVTTLDQLKPEDETKQLNTKNAKHPKPWYVDGRY
ncbi:hypothetical protein VP501E541_P0073 [Vibrio phage 501E54-1]|nr:hypothetical protein VP501E541_P0073 [Vibrio phage 501E54-1]